MDNSGQNTTSMVHYVCDVCDVSATIVSNPMGRKAWRDHMDTHERSHCYREYTWEVDHLPGLEPREPRARLS